MPNLHDIRAKVNTRTHSALYAESRATGQTIEEIVRGILDPWAEQRIHGANVLQNLLRCEGAAGNDRAGEGKL